LFLPFGFDEENALAITLKEFLQKEIQDEIESGCTRFITGMEWGIEIICAEIILKLKEQHPQIHLACVLPFEEQAAKWNEEYRDRYFDVLERSNDMKLISTRFTSDCYQLRDDYIVERSSRILAVMDEEKSDSASLVEKAIRKGMKTIILSPNGSERKHIAGRRRFNIVK
jgi:uncharacterized phage-like protein YoqJ